MGLASEAYGYAKQDDEKTYMEVLLTAARERHHRALIEGMSLKLAEDIRIWARGARHVLSRSGWLEEALEELYFKK